MSDKPWTIGRLLTWTTDFLSGKGAETPRLDAEVLLAHVRGGARIELYTAYEEVADEPLRQAFRELVRERAAGKPVAYLVGHREFFSLDFRVSPEVLIPRPETELLVVRMLDLAKSLSQNQLGGSQQSGKTERPNSFGTCIKSFSQDEPLRIADVGTGSGIVAVCCAKHLPHCHVMAVDISEAALAVARDNAARHEVADRIDFVHGDLLQNCEATECFDLIASNPPYVTRAEMEQLPADVGQFEPRLALDGGEQGTSVIERLLPQATERLRDGGWLLMEIAPMIADRVERLVSATPDFQLHETLKDIAGHARVIQAQKRAES